MITQRLHLTSQDANQVSTIQLHRLGSIVETADGRTYRYTGSGAVALAAGIVTVSPAKVANHTNITVMAAVAVGSRTVTATLGATAATQDQYAGGYLAVIDVAGVGISYRIQGNTAAISAGVVTIALSESIATALTTSSKVSLVPNPWGNVIVHPGGASTFFCSGAVNVAVPVGNFYWSQTGGISATLSDGVIAKGAQAVLTSNAVPGALTTLGGAGVTQEVAVAVEATVDTKYYPVYFQLDA